MKDLTKKILQTEGFGIWARYDKDDKGNYVDNKDGDYALMLFPKNEKLFNSYKDRDIYNLHAEKLSESEVDGITMEDEDTRFGVVTFGMMTKFA